MTISLTIDGRGYTAIPNETFDALLERLGEVELPELPQPNRRGNRPARQTMRVLMARKLIRRRVAAGLTQEQLARAAGVAVKTISRLEAAEHKPQSATIDRIDQALTDAGD
ncbi:MAG: helix-turn-helix transcriptional regulator [Phycisphaeraceae bacterium]